MAARNEPIAAALAPKESGQRRANFTRAGSAETRRTLVRSAAALWRTNGFADTTVADICRAAGVSKGLFYFYFTRKEDVLAEIGVLSGQAARAEARKAIDRGGTLDEIISSVIAQLGRSMRRNPPGLVLETLIEGYRREAAASSEADPSTLMFLEMFTHAADTGELPSRVDVEQLARLAQSAITECARAWASGLLGRRTFDDEAMGRMRILIAGILASSTAPSRSRRGRSPSGHRDA